MDPAAQARFNERVQKALAGTVWSFGCKSWYRSADGRNFTIWPWSTWRYRLETRRVHAPHYRFLRDTEGRPGKRVDALRAPQPLTAARI